MKWMARAILRLICLTISMGYLTFMAFVCMFAWLIGAKEPKNYVVDILKFADKSIR